MQLNDLIDRLTTFRDKYGCIPVEFHLDGHYGVEMSLAYDVHYRKKTPCLAMTMFDTEDD